MVSAFSYLRFSSPQQAEGDSIRRQTAARDAWLAAHPDVVLDTSLRMTDAGKSAYKRADWDAYALAEFVRLIKSGRVERGSYLLVENLDRLSRENAGEATELFLSVVNKGITVVQLSPAVMEFKKPVDMVSLMFAIVELSRGHSESAMKSERVSAAWQHRLKGASQGKIITGKLPCWIERGGDRLVLDEPKAKVVRRIVAMAKDQGITAIAKQLNAEKVPTLSARKQIRGRVIRWSAPTIYTLLTSRALVGEFVPYASTGRGRKPRGKPIPDYFPRLLTDDEYHAVQAALKTRSRIGRGRSARKVNLLAGLLRCSTTDRSLTYRQAKGRKAVLVPVGTGDTWASFPARAFERALLSQMRELDLADIGGNANDAARRVSDLATELKGIETLITAWEARMNNPLTIDRVERKLAELEAQRRKLTEDLAAAQREAASPAAEALGALQSMAEVLEKDDSDEKRLAARTELRRVVAEIKVLLTTAGRHRLALARVAFNEGGSRCYIVVATPPSGFGKGRTPAKWMAWSVEADEAAKIDTPRQVAATVLGAMGDRLKKIAAGASPTADHPAQLTSGEIP